MYSLGFPDMFGSAKTYLVKDHEATSNNLILMLKSERGSLYGDPYFGTDLRKVIFTQNGAILPDLVIDEIYADINLFMHQLKCSRSQINLSKEKTALFASISCTNLIDYTNDLYNFRLTEDTK